MSETTSFFAGCATVGVAIIFLVGSDLRGTNPPQIQQTAPSGAVVPQPLSTTSVSPPPTPPLSVSSDREWDRFMKEFEEQQEVTEELYSQLSEQQSVTQKLAERLEDQGDGLKEQQENTDKIVGLFEEQHSHTKEIVGLFEEQRSQTDQIESLVEEQQSLIESLSQSSGKPDGQIEANRFQWSSAPLFITVTVVLVAIVALIGIMVLLLIALLLQAKKRQRMIQRTYHVPTRLALPTQAEEVSAHSEYSDYPEVYYYHTPRRYVRHVDPFDDVSDDSRVG